MKKNYLLATALAITTLAGCTDDGFVGDQSVKEANGSGGAISFNLNVPAVTRANKTGAEAAADLNQHFIVWGEKNESQESSGTAGKGAAAATNLVFQNYQVNWTANSAFTTTSNTENWEYVGYTHTAKHVSNITTNDKYGSTPVNTALTSAQTIKYWDWGATSYTFTAVSADASDIDADKVTIKKLTSDETDVYGKGYQITIAAWSGDAPTPPAKYTAEKVFIADRKLITKTESGSNTDRTQDNKYGGNVTLTFRNILTHVRVGMYETVPGYTVTINSFTYKNNGTPSNFAAMKAEGSTASSTTNFVANAANVGITSAATLNVTYQKSGSVVNQPTISVSGATAATHLSLGSNIPGTALGETTTTARFDQSTGDYTSFYSQESNDVPLKLMVNYTLTSPTGETITVQDATAEIPASYLQWKPNYKYTYLFKISDNSNGYTGGTSDPAGLYPITFDAVEAIADDGKAEYITTVSEPSITTIGVKDSKYSVGNTDYDAGTDVYATVMDASSLATLSSSNFSIYDVTTSDATNFPVTEASVAEALIEGPTWTAAQAALKKITCAAGPALTFQNTVPAEDGTTKTLDASLEKAAKFTTGTTGKKYAIVYQKTAATYTVDGGKTYSSDEFTAAGTLYTTSGCTTVATSAYYSEHTGDTYYKRTAVSNKGIYAIKIVTVE